MKHNKGMSFIELIIVIAILAVLAGGTIGGLSYIRYANTKTCANEINLAIDKVRLEAMSKTNKPSLYLYEYHDSYYMRVIGKNVSDPAALMDNTGIRLANGQVQLCYRTSAMDPTVADVAINESTLVYLKLGFIKSTGGIEPVSGTNYVNQILIKDQDGNLQYTISLVQATGKHAISKN